MQDPKGGMTWGPGHMSQAFYVHGIQSALKMARHSVDYDQMPWTFQDGLFRDGSDFKYSV